MDKIKEFKVPSPPNDLTISTLFVGGITSETTQEALEERFESFGEIESTRLIASKSCAFVCFKTRKSSEKAFEGLYERLYLKDSTKKLKLLWAKSQLDKN